MMTWDQPGVQRAGTGGRSRSLTQLQSMPPQHLKTGWQKIKDTEIKKKKLCLNKQTNKPIYFLTFVDLLALKEEHTSQRRQPPSGEACSQVLFISGNWSWKLYWKWRYCMRVQRTFNCNRSFKINVMPGQGYVSHIFTWNQVFDGCDFARPPKAVSDARWWTSPQCIYEEEQFNTFEKQVMYQK